MLSRMRPLYHLCLLTMSSLFVGNSPKDKRSYVRPSIVSGKVRRRMRCTLAEETNSRDALLLLRASTRSSLVSSLLHVTYWARFDSFHREDHPYRRCQQCGHHGVHGGAEGNPPDTSLSGRRIERNHRTSLRCNMPLSEMLMQARSRTSSSSLISEAMRFGHSMLPLTA